MKTSGFQIIYDFKGFRKIWPYFKNSKPTLLLVLILLPIISFLSILQPFLLKKAIDDGVVSGNLETLLEVSTFYFIILVIEYVARSMQSLASAFSVQNMILELRATLANHILHLPTKFHDKNLSGALVTRATSDFDNLSESLSQGVIQTFIDSFLLIGSVIGMFILDWRIASVVTAGLPMVLLIIRVFSKAIKKKMMEARHHLANLNAYTQEIFFGITAIKTQNAESQTSKKYSNLNENFRQSQMKSVTYDALLFSILDGMSSIVLGVILWFCLAKMLSSVLSVGLVIAFVRYAQQIFEPIKQLGSTLAMLQGVFTSIERIFGILETKDCIEGSERPDLQGDLIEIKNLSFAYQQDSKQKALEQINLQIVKGASVGIVGRTGCGKSTLIKVISKLYDGYTGSIFIDNINHRTLDQEYLRKQIAIVPQDIVLFKGSLFFNVSLGRKQISKQKVLDVFLQMGVQDFIEGLPNGLDFEVYEQGANLSHGQRQLIAFARALASNPKLVILDEATAVIDPKTEKLVTRALESILGHCTTLIIAHRLQTIKKCDHIIFMDKGKVVEQGNHNELIALHGLYHELYMCGNQLSI